MAKLSEMLGDNFNILSEEIRNQYKDIDLVDSTKYIEKSKFDEVKQVKQQLESDIKDRDIQLETLKKSTGDNAALKQQIEELQADNQRKDEEYKAELKDLQLTNAIKLALSDKAQDIDLVTGLIDKTKLIKSEDGKIMGLEEQIASLQENKNFLFKSNDTHLDNPQFTKRTDSNKESSKISLSKMMESKNINPNMEINFK